MWQSDMHSTLMTVMGVIFFLGANGGIVLSLVQDKPITESVHFTTAMIGFAMLAAQGSITKLFAGAVTLLSQTLHQQHTPRGHEPIALPHTHTHTNTHTHKQNAQSARTAHAFFGTATMGLFLFHASQVTMPYIVSFHHT
jgi:hypothetical protein